MTTLKYLSQVTTNLVKITIHTKTQKYSTF